MNVHIDCYAGYRGEETPRRIRFKNRTVNVADILDRWIAPDHRYFKCRGDDDGVYIIRHDTAAGTWELTVYTNKKAVNVTLPLYRKEYQCRKQTS